MRSPDVLRQLAGADSESQWRSRLIQAVREYDLRGSIDGVQPLVEAREQLARATGQQLEDPKILLSKSDVVEWQAQFMRRQAVLAFTAPKGAGPGGQVVVGNTFGVMLDGDGGAVLFDSHSHYSAADVQSPDRGMLVASFSECTSTALAEFIFETVLPSSRCEASQLEAFAIVAASLPGRTDGTDGAVEVSFQRKCRKLEEKVQELQTSAQEMESTMSCMAKGSEQMKKEMDDMRQRQEDMAETIRAFRQMMESKAPPTKVPKGRPAFQLWMEDM